MTSGERAFSAPLEGSPPDPSVERWGITAKAAESFMNARLCINENLLQVQYSGNSGSDYADA